jgi:hypothetical protein
MRMKPAGSHLGMNKTYERMKIFTTWPGMKQEIEKYIKKCEICQQIKITQHKVKMPLQITTTPEVVWKKCCMDIVGPLTVTTEGHKYILTFQDELSKCTICFLWRCSPMRAMASSFLRFLDHTQRRITVGRTPLDK